MDSDHEILPAYFAAWIDLYHAKSDFHIEEDLPGAAEGRQNMKRQIHDALQARNFHMAVCHSPDALRWEMLTHCIEKYGVNPETIPAFQYLWEHGSWRQHGQADRKRMTWVINRLAPHRRMLFTPDDLVTFDALPERFTIYRGVFKSEYRVHRHGMHLSGRSWTLSEEVAQMFACIYHNPSWSPNGNLVMQKTINKASVLYYASAREEQEIVLIKPTLSAKRRYITREQFEAE